MRKSWGREEWKVAEKIKVYLFDGWNTRGSSRVWRRNRKKIRKNLKRKIKSISRDGLFDEKYKEKEENDKKNIEILNVNTKQNLTMMEINKEIRDIDVIRKIK